MLYKGQAHLVSIRRDSLVHDALLDIGDPVCEHGVQESVDCYGGGSVVFRALESKLVVPAEAGAGNCKGTVSERQPCVGECVNLLELQRVQVVGNGIVGGVLQICIVSASCKQRKVACDAAHSQYLPARLCTVIFSCEAIFGSVMADFSGSRSRIPAQMQDNRRRSLR